MHSYKFHKLSPVDSTKANLPIVLFLAIQPLLDIVSFFAVQNGSTVFSMGLRLTALALFAGYVFYRKESYYKKYVVMFAAIVAVYYLFHLLINWPLQSLSNDFTNFARFAFLPAVFVLVVSANFDSRELLVSIGKGSLYALVVIAISVLVAFLSGTADYTYSYVKLGILGWFSVANSQSAIIVALPLMALLYIKAQGWAWYSFVFILSVSSALQFFIGTRLAYGGIFLVNFIVMYLLFINKIRLIQFYILPIIIMVGAAIMLPSSPMVQRIQHHEKVMDLKQDWANNDAEKIHKKNKAVSPINESDVKVGNTSKDNAQRVLYEKYLPGLVQRFGFEAVTREYGGTTKVSDLTDQRRVKRSYAKLLESGGGTGKRFFGYESSVFTYKGLNYEPENDIHAVYYMHGIIGTALLLGIIAWGVGAHITANLRQLYRSSRSIILIASIAALLFAAEMSGNVLRRPNVSVYVGVVSAALFSTRKVYEK